MSASKVVSTANETSRISWRLSSRSVSRQLTPASPTYPSIPHDHHTIRNRGLYEQDKLSFKLILALKILLTARRLEQSDVTLFIKGGAALDLNAVRPKPYLWLADPAWLNAIQLSRDNVLFKV